MSDDEIFRLANSRLRKAKLVARTLREEFLDLCAAQIGFRPRTGDPKEVHDLLRWLNLRVLMERFALSLPEVTSVLLEIHQRSRHHNRFGQGLGVPISVLLGPVSMASFEAIAEERYPDPEARRKNKMRLDQIFPALDESPLSDDLETMASDYRKRLVLAQSRGKEAARRFRRPFRGSAFR